MSDNEFDTSENKTKNNSNKTREKKANKIDKNVSFQRCSRQYHSLFETKYLLSLNFISFFGSSVACELIMNLEVYLCTAYIYVSVNICMRLPMAVHKTLDNWLILLFLVLCVCTTFYHLNHIHHEMMLRTL